MDNWTLFPGTVIPKQLAESLLDKFQQVYRVRVSDDSLNLPTWNAFPEGSRIDMTILDTPTFRSYNTVYFYFENGRELYSATPQQVKDYFEKRNPWETDWDLYVLDPNFNWCIAFTHELMNGSEVILVGSLEQL